MDLKHSTTNSTTPSSTRIIIGAGALGLFLALEMQKEYPEDEHFLYSRKEIPVPITIKVNQEVFLLTVKIETNLEILIKSISNSEAYIYLCLPPENTNEFFYKLKSFLKPQICFTVIFLNNGILEKKIWEKQISSHSICIIRGIVVAGFMRTILDKPHPNTLVENTSGNKIFYNFLTEINNCLKLTSNHFLQWEKIDNIHSLERAKFFINLILLIYVGQNLKTNSTLFANPGIGFLEQCIHHYCQLFHDNLCEEKYIYEQLKEALYKTKDNVNSVSLAWHRGNFVTANYFLNTLKQFLQNSSKKDSIDFFEVLLKQKGLQNV